ncbi:MAG TPA: zinc ribbon domain-containing protein [Polyangiales bacterium]
MEPVVHYIKSGRSFGPVSLLDFMDLLDANVIGPNDLVRIEGVSSWAPASEAALRVRSGQLPPPQARPASRRPSAAMPPGSHTVFTSAPPLPNLRPSLDTLAPTSDPPRCPNCHGTSHADASFCKRCGTSLRPRRCSGCGGNNDSDSVFCESCGQRLGSLAPPSQREP